MQRDHGRDVESPRFRHPPGCEHAAVPQQGGARQRARRIELPRLARGCRVLGVPVRGARIGIVRNPVAVPVPPEDEDPAPDAGVDAAPEVYGMDTNVKGGCSCRTAGEGSDGSTAWLAALGALGLAATRRRRAR